MIGQRIRQIRWKRGISQGVVEERTGLQRSYISRVEGGHTVPTIKTLELFARALGVTLHQVICESGAGAKFDLAAMPAEMTRGLRKPEALFLRKMKNLAGRLGQRERGLLLTMARKLAEIQ